MPRPYYGYSGVRPQPTYEYRYNEDPDERRLRKLGAVDAFTGRDEESPQNMLQALGALYGISQQEQMRPLEMAHMRAQTEREQAHAGEARGREELFETQAAEYGPAHRKASKMLDEVAGLEGVFGRDGIPEGVKRDLLKRYGYNPDELLGAAPAGAASGAPGETPATTKPSFTSGLTPEHGLGEYNWLRNEVGVPAYNAMVGGSNYLRSLLGLSPFEKATKRPGKEINPIMGQ